MGDQKAEQNNTLNTAKDGPLPMPSHSRYGWKHVLTPLELRTIGASLNLIGLIVLVLSVSTDNWLSDGRLTVGLWSACMQPVCTADTNSMASGIETVKATRALLITAIFYACIAIFLISISFYRNRIYSFSLARASTMASFAASILILIGMSLYTDELLDMKTEPDIEADWSFDAGWVSCALLFLAGLLTVTLSCIES